MTEADATRLRMLGLTSRAGRALRAARAGTAEGAEIIAVVAAMNEFLAQETARLLDAADQAEAAGDQRLADEFFGIAMEIEEELLRGALPIAL
jgi:hypothetical protein